MSQFNTTFTEAGPEGTDLASDIDVMIRTDTKASLAERLNLEHFNLESGVNDSEAEGGQGRHIPGITGCIGKGTLAERAALEATYSPGIGAYWIATDADPDNPTANPAGTGYRYTASGWVNAQFSNGTIYATQAEVDAGTATDLAISPATLAGSTGSNTIKTDWSKTNGATQENTTGFRLVGYASAEGTDNLYLSIYLGDAADNLTRILYQGLVGDAEYNTLLCSTFHIPKGWFFRVSVAAGGFGGTVTINSLITISE